MRSLNRTARPRGDGALVAILAAMIIPSLVALITESPPDFGTRAQAGLLWVVCWLPTLMYWRLKPEKRPPLPFLPIIGISYALYYARPVLFGIIGQHWRIHLDATSDYDAPVQLALIGWLLLLCGYGVARAMLDTKQRSVPGEAPNTGSLNYRKLAFVLVAVAVITTALGIFEERAGDVTIVGGLFRVAAALRLYSFGALAFLFSKKKLSLSYKLLFFVLLAILIRSQIASGFLAPLMLTTATLLVGLWLAQGRLSYRAIFALGLVVVASLIIKGALTQYRKIAWRAPVELSTSEEIALAVRIVTVQVETQGLGPSIQAGMKSLAVRSANLELFGEVIRSTPARVSYWMGDSYLSLAGVAIPRFIWKDKPTKELGQTFGHRYGLLDTGDTHTSLNLPYLVEFYANFGEWGVFMGMFLIGILYCGVEHLINRPRQDVLASIGGMVILLPLLNIESDFSLTFGGLLMDGVAIWYLTKLLRRIVSAPVAARAPVVSTPHRPALRQRDVAALRP